MTKTIILIGRTGSGKSTLANVISGTNKFKESGASISETKNIQSEEFVENNTSYRIIDTVGIGDTNLTREEILDKIAEAVYLGKGGISQILFVTDGRFDQYEMFIYNLLRIIIFDENITSFTIIIRTNFNDFKKKGKCKEDVDLMLEKGSELAEIVESCQRRIVYVDNPPIEIIGADEEEIDINKRKRERSRKILLDNLQKNCQNPYNPPKLKELNAEIIHYMESKIKLKKRLKNLKSKEAKINSKSFATIENNQNELVPEKEETNNNQIPKVKTDVNIKTKISELKNNIEELKKEIQEKERIIQKKVLESIFNNYKNIINIPRGDIFIGKILGEEFMEQELIDQWLEQGFNPEKVSEWINFGFQMIDADFCAWIRDIKELTIEQALNYDIEKLENEYYDQLEKEKGEFDRYNKQLSQKKKNIYDILDNLQEYTSDSELFKCNLSAEGMVRKWRRRGRGRKWVNPYMVFRQILSENLRSLKESEKSSEYQCMVSEIASKKWRSLTETEKKTWKDLAKKINDYISDEAKGFIQLETPFKS